MSIERELQQYLEGDHTAIFEEVQRELDAANGLLSDTGIALGREALVMALQNINALWPFPQHVAGGDDEDRSIMRVSGWVERTGSGELEYLDDRPTSSNVFQFVYNTKLPLDDPDFARIRLSAWTILDGETVEVFIDPGKDVKISRYDPSLRP